MLTVERLLAEDFNPEALTEEDITDTAPKTIPTSLRTTNRAKMADNKSKPWSVKGISDEVRSIAKKQARKSNCTMGEWLTKAILLAAGQPEQLANISETPQEKASEKPIVKDEHLAKVVLQLAERLSSLEKDHVESQAVINSKIETLRRYVLSDQR